MSARPSTSPPRRPARSGSRWRSGKATMNGLQTRIMTKAAEGPEAPGKKAEHDGPRRVSRGERERVRLPVYHARVPGGRLRLTIHLTPMTTISARASPARVTSGAHLPRVVPEEPRAVPQAAQMSCPPSGRGPAQSPGRAPTDRQRQRTGERRVDGLKSVTEAHLSLPVPTWLYFPYSGPSAAHAR